MLPSPYLMRLLVLDPNGKKFQKPVIYDWEPKFCPTCLVSGHSCPPKGREEAKAPNEQPKHRQEPGIVVKEMKTKGTVQVVSVQEALVAPAQQVTSQPSNTECSSTDAA